MTHASDAYIALQEKYEMERDEHNASCFALEKVLKEHCGDPPVTETYADAFEAYIVALKKGCEANGCEVVDRCTDGTGPWVLNKRAEKAEQDAREWEESALHSRTQEIVQEQRAQRVEQLLKRAQAQLMTANNALLRHTWEPKLTDDIAKMITEIDEQKWKNIR